MDAVTRTVSGGSAGMRYTHAIAGCFLGVLLCIGFKITQPELQVFVIAIMSAGAMAGGN